MTAVEEDYAIAEQTMQNDTITFQVNVKVDQSLIHFMKEEEEKQEKKSQS